MKHKLISFGLTSIAAITSSTFSAPSVAQELEVIEVTAQRRAQSLQDVPVAVTSVGADAMENAKVEDITNFTALTPSVKFVKSNNPSSSSNVIVRGVGTVGNTRSFEGATGIFYDDVYRSRPGAAVESFLDVENVQILKGPQGTLFGKNTTAGAILLKSAEPVIEDGLTGNYNVSFGNYNSLKVTGALNIGINDSNAFRVAVLHNDGDGYYTDANTGDDLDTKKTQAIKLQWKSYLTDNLSAHLIIDSLESTGDCCYASSDIESGIVTPLAEALASARGMTIPSSDPGDREASLNSIADVKNTDDGVTLKFDYASDIGDFKSVTAYREYEVIQNSFDADFSPVDLLRLDESFRSEFFSQEFTFNTEIGESGDLLLGAFFSKEDIDIGRTVFLGEDMEVMFDTLLFGTGNDIETLTNKATFNADARLQRTEAMESEVESRAVFAHFTYDFTEKFTGIAGIRYSEDEKTGAVGLTEYNPPAVGIDTFTLLALTPTADFEDTFKDKAVSGVLGLQYNFEDAMAYLTFNRGFKSGGVILDDGGAGLATANPELAGLYGALGIPTTDPERPLYDSEVTDGIELGLKTSYWDGRARTNIAAFYTKIEDIQIAQFVGLRYTVLNASEATTYGLEVENTFLLTEGLTFKADVNWLPHAEYGDDPTIDPVISGQRMVQAPKLIGNLGLNYETDISSNFALAVNGQYSYQGERRTDSSGTHVADSYGLINGSISLISLNNGWQVDLWGQNLTNEDYTMITFATPFIEGDRNGYIGAPRTYGLTLRGKF